MLNQLLKTPLGRLRIVAFVEGCSYLLLGITMVLKYRFSMPRPNYVVGMAHGVLFVLCVVLVLQVAFLIFASTWDSRNILFSSTRQSSNRADSHGFRAVFYFAFHDFLIPVP